MPAVMNGVGVHSGGGTIVTHGVGPIPGHGVGSITSHAVGSLSSHGGGPIVGHGGGPIATHVSGGPILGHGNNGGGSIAGHGGGSIAVHGSVSGHGNSLANHVNSIAGHGSALSGHSSGSSIVGHSNGSISAHSSNSLIGHGSGSIAGHGSHNMITSTNEESGIRDVWKHNIEAEFHAIRKIVQTYHYVAMDTEFPGVVARPVGEFRSTSDYHYQLLRCNVDLLRIIQLGLTFMDEEGNTPPGCSTWQFNFKFNLNEDMYAQDSIDLLQNSGIQFQKHEEDGIDPFEFAELFMSSGIVLVDNIKWLCFHSGYDFGYLLKVLTDQNLPCEEFEFFEFLRIYFPNIYDIKFLMKSCKTLKGGLQEVADQLELRRIGSQHQAGSDALLTGMAFFKMREMFFEDNIDNAKYCGHLYGLGASFVLNGNNFYDNNGDNNSTAA